MDRWSHSFPVTWKCHPVILFFFYDTLYVLYVGWNTVFASIMHRYMMCHSLLFRQINTQTHQESFSSQLSRRSWEKEISALQHSSYIHIVTVSRQSSISLHLKYWRIYFFFSILLIFSLITVNIRLAFKRHKISQLLLWLSWVSHMGLEERYPGRKPCLQWQLFSQCIANCSWWNCVCINEELL